MNYAERNIRCFDQDEHDTLIDWLRDAADDYLAAKDMRGAYFLEESALHIEYLLEELITAKRTTGIDRIEPILTNPLMDNNYTAGMKDHFDKLIMVGDGLAMLSFERMLDNDTVFTNLYHSFEKGAKGKNQQAIEALLKKGREQSASICEDIERSINDDVAITEIWEELTNDEQGYIMTKLSSETQSIIRGM